MTVAGEADTAPPEGAAAASPGTQQGVRRPWRSVVFAPVGDGATRRRGSDGLRVGAAALTILCCWLISYAPASAQTVVVHVATSVPTGVKWCVSVIWWIGTVGTVVVLGVLALLSGRRNVLRDLLVAGGISYVLALGLQLVMGPNGAHAPSPQLAGVNLGFPIARIAAAMGVATAALPYLSRPFRRIVELAIGAAAIATVVHGSGLPISVFASLAIGWGTTAVVHLVFGSPLGLPSAAEVRGSLRDLGVDMQELTPVPGQVWGVARYSGRDAAGPVDVSLYGR
ncbi:MAG TPA: hypothetical protein VEJ21_02225, partial [Acidimicrobiales bacterium]|nr:hypothetical protein [Acidimicrobiales bacterium]